jgi:hypothetical protein
MFGQVELESGEVHKYRKLYSTRDYTPWLKDPKHKHPMLKGGDCIWHSSVTEFFNNETVRKSMNIPDASGPWEECSSRIGYVSGHNASYWIYPLMRHKYRILHYSGDTDGSVPTKGT